MKKLIGVFVALLVFASCEGGNTDPRLRGTYVYEINNTTNEYHFTRSKMRQTCIIEVLNIEDVLSYHIKTQYMNETGGAFHATLIGGNDDIQEYTYVFAGNDILIRSYVSGSPYDRYAVKKK